MTQRFYKGKICRSTTWISRIQFKIAPCIICQQDVDVFHVTVLYCVAMNRTTELYWFSMSVYTILFKKQGIYLWPVGKPTVYSLISID